MVGRRVRCCMRRGRGRESPQWFVRLRPAPLLARSLLPSLCPCRELTATATTEHGGRTGLALLILLRKPAMMGAGWRRKSDAGRQREPAQLRGARSTDWLDADVGRHSRRRRRRRQRRVGSAGSGIYRRFPLVELESGEEERRRIGGRGSKGRTEGRKDRKDSSSAFFPGGEGACGSAERTSRRRGIR